VTTFHPSASFSATLRVRLENRPGTFAHLADAIGEAGGLLGAIDLVRAERGTKIRDVTVLCSDALQMERIAASVHDLDGIEVINVSDRTFLMHLGGKIEIALKTPLKTRDDLSMAYTPGVARVSSAIAADPVKVWNLTIKQNTVAVVSDGTAVLGLGDIGPEAALPVMEGKAMLFKEFGGVDAFPICLATTEPDEIVAAVKAIAPVFGGINLEDISAPRCFEVEDRLRDELDIPVFHDDQHGTAIVTLAALINALQVVGKRPEELRVVVTGVGAAGMAVTKTLLAAGVSDVVGCDREGAVYVGRPGLTLVKAAYAAMTNPRHLRGTADEALAGADVFIGVSKPGAVTVEGIRSMADGAIVFAMANPTPEILPEEIEGVASVIGTGRSDYPNQINNVLAFPGVFRGAFDVRATAITEGMKLAAAEAIAAVVKPDELEADYVIPSVFNRDVAPAVADAVARAAEEAGVARRHRAAAQPGPGTSRRTGAGRSHGARAAPA
jgi:malate dehydrogenase (oxaloacetate-decarboxylating)